MNRRRLTLLMLAVLALVACRLTVPENVPPITPSQSATDVPATQTLEPETPTAEVPALDRTSQLEVIRSGNWSRLQLLKTFPAEMPLLHSAVAISPDGATMAVGSSNSAAIHFFDLPGGQLSRTISVNGVSKPDAYFHVIEYLSDGTVMANADGPYMIYHMDSAGNVLSRWEGSSFAISPDKKIMAYGTLEGTTLVEVASGNILGSFDGDYALDYSVSPDGSKMASNVVGVDYANTVVWDVVNKSLLSELLETGNPRFSPDDKFLAVTSYKETTNPLKIFTPDGATELTTLQVSDANGLNGSAPLWSLDGSVIAAQVANGAVVAWDTSNWQTLDSSALEGVIYSVSPDGQILITRTIDGGILLWGVPN